MSWELTTNKLETVVISRYHILLKMQTSLQDLQLLKTCNTIELNFNQSMVLMLKTK